MKVHSDCLSSIIVSEDQVITTGYDGKVNFINFETKKIDHSIDTETPIFQAVIF